MNAYLSMLEALQPLTTALEAIREKTELEKKFLGPSQSLIAQAESWREKTESVEDTLKSVHVYEKLI